MFAISADLCFIYSKKVQKSMCVWSRAIKAFMKVFSRASLSRVAYLSIFDCVLACAYLLCCLVDSFSAAACRLMCSMPCVHFSSMPINCLSRESFSACKRFCSWTWQFLMCSSAIFVSSSLDTPRLASLSSLSNNEQIFWNLSLS